MSGEDSSLTEREKQELYRDARYTNRYNDIWQSVGKCVFCDLKEKYVFYEENGIVMTISLYAYIDGHFMILPRRHVRSTKELTETEWETIRKFSYIAQKIIKKVHDVKGMQLIYKDGATAQSTVNDHIHFHAVPFDKADLTVWNYRKLVYTPLENVALYKKARKQIVDTGMKFDSKYKQPSTIPIVCDLIVLNTKNEVLLEERNDNVKLDPDYLTPPGGRVDNFDVPLETELAREVMEETGLDITKQEIKLVSSRLGSTRIIRHSSQLKVKYPTTDKFLQNTYLLSGIASNIVLTPGDDCKRLVWIPIKEAANHSRISPEIRQTLKGILKNG